MKRLLLLSLLLLSACVDRADPEKPPEELPTQSRPSIGFDSPISTGSESNGSVTITLHLSGAAPAGAHVSLAYSGTASPTTDLIEAPSSIEVQQGATAVQLTLKIRNDGETESPETLAIALVDPFNLNVDATTATHTVSLIDAFPKAGFATPEAVVEENVGLYRAVIQLTSPAPSSGVITYSASGNVNTISDVSGLGAAVAIPLGAESVNIEFTVVNDGVTEGPEHLVLTLLTATGVDLDPALKVHDLTIIDKRPVLSFAKANTYSVEKTPSNAVVLALDIPAPLPVTLEFTAAGTANIGQDVNLAVAPITIPVGSTGATIPIQILPDSVLEGTENIKLTLISATNAVIDHAQSSHGFYILADTTLNDTGVTTFATISSNAASTSPSDAPGQDAKFGRDAAAGKVAFDFVKLDADGNPLPSSSSSWACFRDNTTGQIWENKTGFVATPSGDKGKRVPLPVTSTPAYNFRYTWYNTDATANGGSPGSQNVDTDSQDVDPQTQFCSFPSASPNGPSGRSYQAYCNTEVYIKERNSFAFCGRSNWRMPTITELRSAATYDPSKPALTTSIFEPTANSYRVFSSTTAPGSPATVYCFDPATRSAVLCAKNSGEAVRLVSDLIDRP